MLFFILSLCFALLTVFLISTMLKREQEKSSHSERFVCSTFVLSSSKHLTFWREFMSSRTNCKCGKKLMTTGRFATVQIYTRNGTFVAQHLEKRFFPNYFRYLVSFVCRCWKCLRGYFYGFSTEGKSEQKGKMKIIYEETALENKFLFTSRKTG